MSQLLKNIFQTNHQLKQLLFKIALMDLSDPVPVDPEGNQTIDSPQPGLIQNSDTLSFQESEVQDSQQSLLNKIISELQSKNENSRTNSKFMRNEINESVIEKYHLAQIKLNQQKECHNTHNNKVAIKYRKTQNRKNILEAIEEESDEEKESNTTEDHDSLQQLELIQPVAIVPVLEQNMDKEKILQVQIHTRSQGKRRFAKHNQ